MTLLAVTGGGGFIGSRLIRSLGDHPVRAIVQKPVDYLDAGCQVAIDLTEPTAALAEALAGVDAVVHLAGHNEVVAAQDPDRALAETVLVSRHVAAAAADAGVRRIVYVSTVHVYGERLRPGPPISEDVAPEPRSEYAVARLASEHLLAEATTDATDLVVLRLTNAVGAPVDATVDRWTLVAADLCLQAARDGELRLRSSGTQWRDFIALRDVCTALERCADPGGTVAAGTYNLGSGRSHTVLELAELVRDRHAARTGVVLPLHVAPADGPPPEPYTVATARLAAQGIEATTPLADAVDELLDLTTGATP